MRALLFLVALIAVPLQFVRSDEEDAVARIGKILRPGTYKCEILTATPPEDVVQILAKFEAAFDREWFLAYANKHSGKHPLPYHANFGISKREYQRIQESKTETKLLPAQQCSVSIIKNSAGEFEFSGTKGAKCLNGLKINSTSAALQYEGIRVADCTLGEPKKDAIVSVASVDWNYADLEPKPEMARIYFCIGIFEEDPNAVFVNLIANKLRDGKMVLRHDIAMRFFLSDKPSQDSKTR